MVEKTKLVVQAPANVKYKKYSLLIFIMLLVIYHLITLNISPLPWFDETFFASITASFNSSTKFLLNIAPFAYDGEILMYGPTYFWITSISTKTLGFDLFTFRLPSLIFGTLCLFVYYKLLRVYLSIELSIAVVATLAIDPLLSTHLHSGRMETVALFFALLSILLVIKNIKGNYSYSLNILMFAFAGVSFSIALLTTPRIGILLLALCMVMAYYFFKRITILKCFQLLSFGLSLLIIYLLWLYVAFSDMTTFINYYSSLTEYVGGNLAFPKQLIPLIVISILAFTIGLIVDHKMFISELSIYSIVSIVAFYLVVNDTGAYSVIILPSYYSLLGLSVSVALQRLPLAKFKTLIGYLPLIALLSYNSIFFAIKFVTLYNTSDLRDPEHITTFVQSSIPPNSKVVGDEIYYYAVFAAKSDFQYMHLFKDDKEREQYHREVYDYDFIIISKELQEAKPHLLELYNKESELIKLTEFNTRDTDGLPIVDNVSNLLGVKVRSSYDGIIYKRVKEN